MNGSRGTTPFTKEDRPTQDREQGAAADWDRASANGSSVSSKRRSRRRSVLARGRTRSSPVWRGRETRLRSRSAPATRRPRPDALVPQRRPGLPPTARRCPPRSAMPPDAAATPARARAPCTMPCSRPSRINCLDHSLARSTTVISTSSSVSSAPSASPGGANDSATSRTHRPSTCRSPSSSGRRSHRRSRRATSTRSHGVRVCSSRTTAVTRFDSGKSSTPTWRASSRVAVDAFDPVRDIGGGSTLRSKQTVIVPRQVEGIGADRSGRQSLGGELMVGMIDPNGSFRTADRNVPAAAYSDAPLPYAGEKCFTW